MRFEETHARVLVKRILLNVDTGRVDMRCDHAEAVRFGIFTSHAEDHDRFAAVDEIFFVTRFERVAEGIFGETLRLCRLDGDGASLALGFRRIEIGFIAFRISENFFPLLFARHFKIVGFLVRQFFL